jgi:hypothetical protein
MENFLDQNIGRRLSEIASIIAKETLEIMLSQICSTINNLIRAPYQGIAA